MRRKIAKRLKKKLRSLGCKIEYEHFIKEPGWKRKQCCYAAEVIFKNCRICSVADDELACYRMVLEDVMEEIREPFLTKGYRSELDWDVVIGGKRK